MNIVADGQERYVAANPGKILRARRLVIREVCRAHHTDLKNANGLKQVYLKCKRWLELHRKLNELQQDLDRNLYLKVGDS